jgi:hypothetical protein
MKEISLRIFSRFVGRVKISYLNGALGRRSKAIKNLG